MPAVMLRAPPVSTYPMSITEYVDGTRLACQSQASGATRTRVASGPISSGRRLTLVGLGRRCRHRSGLASLAILAAITRHRTG